jgi:predicted methyltransferase
MILAMNSTHGAPPTQPYSATRLATVQHERKHRSRRITHACLAMLVSIAGCSTALPATDSALEAAIASPTRAEANRARDGARHPYETLRAFEITPRQTVIEIAPGGGWYTEILAPYLRDGGRYLAALYVDPGKTPAETAAQTALARDRFTAKFGRDPARYGTVEIGTLGAQGLRGVGGPASADAVLTFRNIHNWIADGDFDVALQSFYTVLKPGGTLGVEEHRAVPGTSLAKTIATGYVPEAYVIEHARAAGFRLVSSSEANANPRDTRDHPHGVWSLPPTLQGGAVDRDSFLAIGESDRMTLRFIKPAP